jgi:heptosyltransferase-2
VVDWQRLERIYVRLPNWVGDVVLATPFLRALRAAAPAARILVHGKGFQLAIVAGEGTYDESLKLSSSWPLTEGRRIRETFGAPDLALILPNSFSSALTAWASGARHRIGYALNARGALLTHPIRVKRQGHLRPIPMVDYYLGILSHAGANVAAVPRVPTLTPTPEAEDWAERFLTRLRLNAPSNRVWALNIGGSWETKRWIPQHAGRLVKRLRAEGISPLLLRGPDEAGLADQVCEAAGERVPGADEVVGLCELTAVMSRCELLITTDSGPRHFGIAAGIPVVVLIGPTHPGYTAVDYEPLGLLCQRVPCWPCHLKHCPVDFKCMKSLTAERVFAGATRHLESQIRGQIRVS